MRTRPLLAVRWLTTCCLSLCILPAVARADEPPQDDPAVIKAQLESKLPLLDKDKLNPLTAGRFLADLAGANIYVNASALSAAGYGVEDKREFNTVYLSLKNVTLSVAMDRMLKTVERPQAPLKWAVDNGVIVFSTADDKNWASLTVAAEKNDKDAAYKDDRVLDDINFDNIALHKVNNTLRADGINVYFHWAVVGTVGVDQHSRVNVILKHVRPRTAMQTIIRDLAGPNASISYALRDGVWVISTPEDLAKQMHLWDWRPQHVKDQPTADKLATPLPDFGVEEQGLGDVLDGLGRIGDIVMDVDWPSLAKAGIDRNTHVTAAASNVKVSTAINMVLTEAGGADHALDYTAKDGTVTITLKPEPATKPTAKPTRGAK